MWSWIIFCANCFTCGSAALLGDTSQGDLCLVAVHQTVPHVMDDITPSVHPVCGRRVLSESVLPGRTLIDAALASCVLTLACCAVLCSRALTGGISLSRSRLIGTRTLLSDDKRSRGRERDDGPTNERL